MNVLAAVSRRQEVLWNCTHAWLHSFLRACNGCLWIYSNSIYFYWLYVMHACWSSTETLFRNSHSSFLGMSWYKFKTTLRFRFYLNLYEKFESSIWWISGVSHLTWKLSYYHSTAEPWHWRLGTVWVNLKVLVNFGSRLSVSRCVTVVIFIIFIVMNSLLYLESRFQFLSFGEAQPITDRVSQNLKSGVTES